MLFFFFSPPPPPSKDSERKMASVGRGGKRAAIERRTTEVRADGGEVEGLSSG